MKRLTISFLALAGAVSITIMIYAFAFGNNENSEEAKWKTQKVCRSDISTSVLATGIIKPQVGAEVKIGSRASGTVKDLYVNIGDDVNTGMLLAELDDAEYQARVKSSEANVNNAQVNLKYAELELNRIRKLNQKDYASKQALDDAEKEFETCKAKLLQEQANLDFANIQLGYTKITAPISGVIGSVTTQKGETVSATITAPTFVSIIDLNRLEVWAYVDETDIGRVEVGQQASFTVDTYTDTEFNGKVTAIYPQAEIINNVVNYIVIIEINIQGNEILRPEMTTSVNVYTLKRDNVLTLKNKFIKRKGNRNYVYVLQDNQPVEKEVSVGLRGNI